MLQTNYNSWMISDKYTLHYNLMILEDRLPQVIKYQSNIKVMVDATYQAKQSLISKNMTPSIFIEEYYRKRKDTSLQVSYIFKEKTYKPFAQVTVIDAEDYEMREDVNSQKKLNERMNEILHTNDIKIPKTIDQQIFRSKNTIQVYLNNTNFGWFQKCSQFYYYYYILGSNLNRCSTLQQPNAITYILEVNDKNPINQYEKLSKRIQTMLNKMYILNPQQIKYIPIIIIILYDANKNQNIHAAENLEFQLCKKLLLRKDMIVKVQINGQNTIASQHWSNYSKPILHHKNILKPSDFISIISQQGHQDLCTIAQRHKQSICRVMEDRLNTLAKKYQQINKTTNKILNFFKSTTPTDKNYTHQQSQARQLGDLLFIFTDYRRAYEVYKNLHEKMEGRDKEIQSNIEYMLHLCLSISKLMNIRIKSDPYNQIQKYAQKHLKITKNINKHTNIIYQIFLIYVIHTFKIYNRTFIKQTLQLFVKSYFNDHNNLFCISILILQQCANFSLLYNHIQYRKYLIIIYSYCYNLVRIASKFAQLKFFHHSCRCLVVAKAISNDKSFYGIQRYVNTHLSRAFMLNKRYQQALICLKTCRLNKVQFDIEEQYGRTLSNHYKIINESNQCMKILEDESISQQNRLKVIQINQISIRLYDQVIEYDDRKGTKWAQIGDDLIDNKKLINKGMNKKNFIKLLHMFDTYNINQKQLLFRTHCDNQYTIKKYARNTFVNQPFQISFYITNPIKKTQQIQQPSIIIKNHPQNYDFIQTPNDMISFQYNTPQKVTFKVLPKKTGFFQLQKIMYKFHKILVCQNLNKSQNISSFTKLNILQQAGRLQHKISYNEIYIQQTQPQIEYTFTNRGTYQINGIYIAFGRLDIFNKSYEYYDIQIQPNQTKTVTITVSLPKVPSSNITGSWKSSIKTLFLYQTRGNFRMSRNVSIITIERGKNTQKQPTLILKDVLNEMQVPSKFRQNNILPFSFKSNIKESYSNNFQEKVILIIPIRIRIRNIFYKNPIKIKMSCIQLQNNLIWQGLTQHTFTLKQKESQNINNNILLFKEGTYNLSEYIYYTIIPFQQESYNLMHKTYQDIYFQIKEIKNPKKQIITINKTKTQSLFDKLGNLMDDDDIVPQKQIKKKTQEKPHSFIQKPKINQTKNVQNKETHKTISLIDDFEDIPKKKQIQEQKKHKHNKKDYFGINANEKNNLLDTIELTQNLSEIEPKTQQLNLLDHPFQSANKEEQQKQTHGAGTQNQGLVSCNERQQEKNQENRQGNDNHIDLL